ncbi:hypothetical protein EUX98_g2011 [Antrodiella citrinella]|uniref:Uncharacterized protein n=1 Tax=Antrodiella citrinella TaxID=2447956 RepID=A0A4S4N034_9APHY|nr:hypothetical protein EUX98_g2011 [Antrodiella citrinella]
MRLIFASSLSFRRYASSATATSPRHLVSKSSRSATSTIIDTPARPTSKRRPPDPPPHDATTAPETFDARMAPILHTLSRPRYHRFHTQATLRVHVFLDTFNRTDFYQACEALIYRLLSMKNFVGAVTVFRRMRFLGLLPSAHIQQQMRLLQALAEEPAESDLLRIIERMFKLLPGDDAFLRAVVHIIGAATKATPEFFQEIIDAHKRMSVTHTAVSDATMALVKSYVVARSPKPVAPEGWMKEGYIFLEKNHPSLAEAFLYQISVHRDARHDQILGNLLIQAQLIDYKYDVAFQLYRTLRRTTSFQPNWRTFWHLFFIFDVKPRSFKSRKIRTSSALPGPRVFFHDMLHLQDQLPRKTPSHARVFHVDTLKRAIQTFLTARDYAAVHVALRTGTAYGLPLITPIYRLVVKHLAEQVVREGGQQPFHAATSWTQHFLKDYQPAGNMGPVHAVLSMGAPPKTTASAPPEGMPSVAAILGLEPAKKSFWDPAPLCNVLERAMLASRRIDDDDDNMHQHRWLQRELAAAGREMTPTESPFNRTPAKKKNRSLKLKEALQHMRVADVAPPKPPLKQVWRRFPTSVSRRRCHSRTRKPPKTT